MTRFARIFYNISTMKNVTFDYLKIFCIAAGLSAIIITVYQIVYTNTKKPEPVRSLTAVEQILSASLLEKDSVKIPSSILQLKCTPNEYNGKTCNVEFRPPSEIKSIAYHVETKNQSSEFPNRFVIGYSTAEPEKRLVITNYDGSTLERNKAIKALHYSTHLALDRLKEIQDKEQLQHDNSLSNKRTYEN